MLSYVWDPRAARVLSTTLAFIAVLAFLHGSRETLTLFLFAILFAYFVEPLVDLFSRFLNGRVKAIIVTYLLLGGIVAGLVFLLGPRIANEARELTASLPALLDRIASGQFLVNLGRSQGWKPERTDQIQQYFVNHRTAIFAYGESFAADLEAPLSHIWWVFLIPILGVFFLKNAKTMAGALVHQGEDRRKRRLIDGIVGDVHIMLGSYIRAQLILAGLTAVVLTPVIALMHVPFSFILGPLAGAFEFIPVVGPAVACALIFGIALVSGYNHLLWLFLVLGTWRILQDYVNAPRVMGRSLEISPLLEIFAVLAGGEMGGVVGALISVPAFAILRILWERLSFDEQLQAGTDAQVTSDPV
ncbi:MAG: AI-2E family transporter [Janthinobacterium lividum]